jgi:two-component SAPR family response regulator
MEESHMQKTAKLYYHTSFPADARLVILHPNFHSQHLFIPDIAADSQRLVFMTFRSPDSGLAEAWQLLGAALEEGFSVALPRLDAQWSAERAAQQALKVIRPLEPVTLLIDGYDLAPADPLATWVVEVAAELSAGSRIVIGTRYLPLNIVGESLQRPVMRDKIALFPVDEDRMLLNYLSVPDSQAVLEVYAHGAGQALVNGRLIDHWDGVLPRNLFFYLVDRGMTTRDEIFQTFWPDLTVRDATNVFHVTKRKISEILGFDLTMYSSGFYRISSDIDLHYDVVSFGEFVQNSTIAPDDEAVAMLEKAVFLYQGTFLSGMEADWIAARREALRSMYQETLTALGKHYESRRELPRALSLYQRAMAIQPHREDLARNIMAIYRQLDQPDQALRLFDHLAEVLKRGFGLSPDKKTVELAEQIRKDGKPRR